MSLNVSRLIKAKAAELGFSACGISPATRLEGDESRLADWLDAGKHGSMSYMAGHFDKRVDPSALVEGAKSVITVLFNYYTERVQEDPAAPVISKYAFGKDYHVVLKERLKSLLAYIQTAVAPCNGRAFADSAPLLEKALAREAGLGWIGKNSLLIHPKMGSFLFIGELVVDLPMAYDVPFGKSRCGSCTRCLDSCPTGALTAPMQLDARKCISYLTIETKLPIPEDLSGQLSNCLIGCDICQLVCPWNNKASQNLVPEFEPSTELMTMQAKAWSRLNKTTYRAIFKGTAAERAGFERIKRTLNLQFGKNDVNFTENFTQQ